MKIAEAPKRYKVKRGDTAKGGVRSGSRAGARSGPVPTRVTVRLKSELAARLAAARQTQGLSVTQIVEAALEHHLQPARRAPKMTLLEALKKHGVLGAVDLGAHASRDYKRLVGEAIEEKYGYR